jgi:hypothetical protein
MTTNTDFVQSVIGGLSGTMGNIWDSNMSQLVVNDAVEAYGVTAEADATDSVKLHALLRYFTWVRVRDELLLDPSSYKTDGESFTFQKELLDKRVAEAWSKSSSYLPDAQIDQGIISYPDDPYSIDGQVWHDA